MFAPCRVPTEPAAIKHASRRWKFVALIPAFGSDVQRAGEDLVRGVGFDLSVVPVQLEREEHFLASP
jgi:hypothetical protein